MNWKDWFERLREEPASTWDAHAWMAHLDSTSGFEREVAVRNLGRLRAPEALPGLLVRLNDWVPAVRAAAREAVSLYLTDDLLSAWPTALPAMIHLLRGKRDDHWPMLSAIGGFLGQPARAGALVGAQAPADPAVRRWLVGIEWLATGEAARAAMLTARMGSADIVDAMWALRQVDLLGSAAARPALWLNACTNPHGIVRAQALRRLCAEAPEIGAAAAVRMALDATTGVRDVAIAQLRKSGGVDEVRAVAEALLQAPSQAPRGGAPALLFLAAVDPAGRSARAAALMARIDADKPVARVRALALQHLIATTSGDAQDEWILTALRDGSTVVQRVAVNAIANGAGAPGPRTLWPVMLGHGTRSAFHRGLRILQHWGLWVQLESLLTLFQTRSPIERGDELVSALQQWLRATRSGVTPPPEPQATTLRTLWDACETTMPHWLRHRMAFELTGIGLLQTSR
ncbi:hypothetical protein ACQ859_06260 [Roseateles chitinivorans]|uniref:hypothetical protein n=1 Tax=Roseateles chitinivorans TaxID=2917965 RepID=UPI003D6652EA